VEVFLVVTIKNMEYTEHKFKVFVDELGRFGDPVSLLVDEGQQLSFEERLRITAEIQNVETVFVNRLAANDVSIYHAQDEVDFAGSVLIGAAWQLEQLKNEPTQQILCKRGTINVRQESSIYWVQASLENNIGNWDYEQLESPEDVEAIDIANTKHWKKMVWAWVNQDEGVIRARTFADTIGIPEVQGNGSGSMNLAGQLQRQITIKHGDGSVIYAKPLSHDSAEVGGRVISSI
jgi:predicted PhzF superfamily epimerase YddE/YHI9